MSKFLGFLNSGIMSSIEMHKLFHILKKKKISLAAINCVDTNSINAVLETAKKSNTIVIIQFSFLGSSFFSGKFLSSYIGQVKSSLYGAILGAKYVHEVSKYYNLPVILHTDHCNKNNLPWIDYLLEYEKGFYDSYGKNLFTSHMIDLSTCNIKENIDICSQYLIKMSKLNINLELELGCTGGEEDGLDNTSISNKKLYTNPKDVLLTYTKLIKISKYFNIAASFGNTHGVYKPGNVVLCPKILRISQKLIKNKYLFKENNPVSFVFHGGSGSSKNMIKESIKYGVVKINLDTDVQWNYWNGIFNYYKNNKNYLKSQLGNPKGIYNPNKKFYDPRIWLRNSQKFILRYLIKIFSLFNCKNLLI